MTLSDELLKLEELHRRGSLTEEEFARAKARVLGAPAGEAGATAASAPFVTAINALRRSRQDRWLAGVCGGLAASTGVVSWLWRLLFALLVPCAGTGVLIYLLMWFFMPLELPRFGAEEGELRAG
jgi:phage shock protein C